MIIYTGTQDSASPSLNSSMQEGGEVQFSILDNKALEAKIGTAKLEVKRGMILPFQPLSISFADIKYYVDMPAVRLLHLLKFS